MSRLDLDLDDPAMPPEVRAYLMDRMVAGPPATPRPEERHRPIEFTPHSGPATWRDQPLTNGLGSVKVFPQDQELPEQVAKLRGLYP